MNAEEVARQLAQKFAGSRLTDVEIVGGQVTAVKFTFENTAEERGSITIQGSVRAELGAGQIVVKPETNFNIGEFKK